MVDQEDFRLYKELNFRVVHRQLVFRKPAKTSRDTLQMRDVWYLLLSDKNGVTGIGECAPIFGLSSETESQVLFNLNRIQQRLALDELNALLQESPSLRMAFETAINDFKNGGIRNVFPSESAPDMPINGLVWMNEKDEMLQEAFDKIKAGFKCIKLKIGGILFEDELAILKVLRANFSSSQLEIRLDANGAFAVEDAMIKLDALAQFDIHSIEQPLKAGQFLQMKTVIENSPIPVALDEELIGVDDFHAKEKLLMELQPNYIILKPTLHGGFSGCDEWIDIAERQNIKWWATSALESNIGLNAIAQWVQTKISSLPQGLGTGSLFTNNIPSPIRIDKGYLNYAPANSWDVSTIIAPDN